MSPAKWEKLIATFWNNPGNVINHSDIALLKSFQNEIKNKVLYLYGGDHRRIYSNTLWPFLLTEQHNRRLLNI